METINSLASAASKAVFGESNNNNTTTTTTTTNETTSNTTTANQEPLTVSDSTSKNTDNMSATNETLGQEPVSGKLGDTSKGEPFDAGNIETGNTATTKTPSTTTNTGLDTAQNTTGSTTTGSTGTTGLDTKTPNTTTNTNDTTTGATTTGATSTGGPTTEHPSTTGDTGGFKAAQADIRDPETSATTDPKTEAERKNVDDTGALDSSENPGKVDGPGPRPVDEVARERGGDAGAVAGSGPDAASKTGKEGGAEIGAAEDSGESKGTGEEYVKSTGLQADGGDFDATKPGAGKEADRLLEEKGIVNPSAAAAASKKEHDEADADEASHDGKEKKSLKDKIKAKLHKN